MKWRNFRTFARSRAMAAAMLAVVVIVLIGALVLTDRDFGFEFPTERKDAAVIVVDAALGATVEPLDRATAEGLGISPRDKGLVITSLREKGPAAQARITAGDVIERIGGIPVHSPGDAAEALKGTHPPDIVLTLNRRGRYAVVRLPMLRLPDAPGLATQGAER
jgi:predicted metalloprotease with PDZ domain